MKLPWKPKTPSAPINIFDFNHIDPDLPKETVEMLKKYYTFYHKKHWDYSKLHRGLQQKYLVCNIVAGKAIITSVVAEAITLNPIVFATLTGFGLVVKGVASLKKYDKKAEKADFARIEYKKILNAIRFYLRGDPFGKEFLDKLKIVDDFVSDHCMEIPVNVQTNYGKLFSAG